LRVETRTDGESPVAVKLALDYTLLEPPAELLQLKRLIEKATPQVTAGPEPLQIEGEAMVCLPQRCDFIRSVLHAMLTPSIRREPVGW
jgi:hypothetical protein